MHRKVDNTDWLKTFAIVSAAIDHFAIYFISTHPLQEWLQVPGRLAAPIFFFLIGFSTSSTVPLRWLLLGATLMIFDAWGDDWSWGPGSILFSFALFRYLRPAIAQVALGTWLGSAVIISSVAVAGTIYYSSRMIDTLVLYGASGWLWSLLGLYHREYLDSSDALKMRFELLRWIVAFVAVAVFWLQIAQSYKEFSVVQLSILAASFSVLAASLLQFARGVSRWQPGVVGTRILRFVGHNTLEIYAIQLMLSAIAVKLWPDLFG